MHVAASLLFLVFVAKKGALQKDEVFNEEMNQSFQNAVAVMPLFARSVAAELREASDQVGRHYHLSWHGQHIIYLLHCLATLQAYLLLY